MKKVVIATWYGPANYGTALQAIALKQYLEYIGYDVSYLDDRRDFGAGDKEKKTSNRVLERAAKIFKIAMWKRLPYKTDLKRKEILQSKYMDKYTSVKIINTEEDANRIGNEADIFVSGGDQIWNPYVTNRGFMLDFVPDSKKKISYGTSVGVKNIPNAYAKMYKKYLTRYDAISVREKQSAVALQPILNRYVDVVLDPTLLFSGEEWTFLMNDADLDEKILNEPYILTYFVGTRKSYWNYVSKIKKETGYKVIVVPINEQAYLNHFRKYVKVSPAEFLALIKNARIICTDSFHATVFSILFGKEFYTLKRFSDSDSKGQNGRLEYLLSKYGLAERLIKDESCFERMCKIDYMHVFEIIEKERGVSKQWLKKAIEM